MPTTYRSYISTARKNVLRAAVFNRPVVESAVAEECDRDRPNSTRGEVIIAIFTGVLTIVGIGGACATYLQWDAAKKGLEFARESAASSAKDTQAALKISSRSAEASEQQAKAAADSASAAKTTAALARGQTSAIIEQANALVRSADATVRATNAQLAAAHAQTLSAEAVSATAAPTIRFGGLQIQKIKSDPDTNGRVNFTVQPFFVNVGSVAIIPGRSIVHLIFAKTLPADNKLGATIIFGGNDISVQPNAAFNAFKEHSLWVARDLRDQLIARKVRIFVWGVTEFTGPRGGDAVSACFAAEIWSDNDDWTEFSQARMTPSVDQCSTEVR